MLWKSLNFDLAAPFTNSVPIFQWSFQVYTT